MLWSRYVQLERPWVAGHLCSQAALSESGVTGERLSRKKSHSRVGKSRNGGGLDAEVACISKVVGESKREQKELRGKRRGRGESVRDPVRPAHGPHFVPTPQRPTKFESRFLQVAGIRLYGVYVSTP